MTGQEHEQRCDIRVFCFAKLLVALELRRTHGKVFAAAFLDQFAPEVTRAAVKLALHPRTDDSGSPFG